MDVTCYIRVFDLERYREIQPIVESIYGKSADPDLVTALIRESIDKIETDEFKKYHEEWIQESYSDNLQSALKLVQSGRLSEWHIYDGSTEELDDDNLERYEEDDGVNLLLKQQILSLESFTEEYHSQLILSLESFDEECHPLTEQDLNNLPEDDAGGNKETIEIIMRLLCYPNYQDSISELNSVSENIAEYSNINGIWYDFNQVIHNLVNNGSSEYPTKYLFIADGRSISILEPNLLPDITKMVIEDLANLSQPDWILYSVETHWYNDEISEFEKAEEEKYAIIDRQVQDGTLILDEFYYGMRSFARLLAESRRHEVFNRRYNMFPKTSPPENLDDGDVAVAIPEIQDELIAFYQRLANILELVNSQSRYTISNETWVC
jgi:hypothetical protein